MTGERVLPDVNAVAIQLVEDHPGYPSVAEKLTPALLGEDTLLAFGHLPLRVQHVLERFGIDTVDARNAVSSLLQYPIEFVETDANTTLDAYGISAAKNHDAYDCFLVAVARSADADAIVTTDRDFEQLCEDESFAYRNPVPADVLTAFDQVDLD